MDKPGSGGREPRPEPSAAFLLRTAAGDLEIASAFQPGQPTAADCGLEPVDELPGEIGNAVRKPDLVPREYIDEDGTPQEILIEPWSVPGTVSALPDNREHGVIGGPRGGSKPG